MIGARNKVALAATAGLLSLAMLAIAQQERNAYRDAYRAWRTADPDLERDAATGGATIGARADKVAAQAAKYYAARKVFLDGLKAAEEKKAAAIAPEPIRAAADPVPANYAAAQSTTIAASIETIANDPDKAIQQLRQALEAEHTALTSLSAAANETLKGAQSAAQ